MMLLFRISLVSNASALIINTVSTLKHLPAWLSLRGIALGMAGTCMLAYAKRQRSPVTSTVERSCSTQVQMYGGIFIAFIQFLCYNYIISTQGLAVLYIHSENHNQQSGIAPETIDLQHGLAVVQRILELTIANGENFTERVDQYSYERHLDNARATFLERRPDTETQMEQLVPNTTILGRYLKLQTSPVESTAIALGEMGLLPATDSSPLAKKLGNGAIQLGEVSFDALETNQQVEETSAVTHFNLHSNGLITVSGEVTTAVDIDIPELAHWNSLGMNEMVDLRPSDTVTFDSEPVSPYQAEQLANYVASRTHQEY